MRLSVFCASATFSGGRMAMLRHANEMARRGHDVSVWIQGRTAAIDWMTLETPVHPAPDKSLDGLPRTDVCLFDRIRLAPLLVKAAIGTVVHLCQGFEGTDTEIRMNRVWRSRGLFGLREYWKLWRRRRHIDHAYSLPTVKVVTHRHLGEQIAQRYGQPSHLVPYGLPPGVFSPPNDSSRRWHGRTVLVVGPTDIGWKRVTDALRAVRLVKNKLGDVRLIRVAQHPMREPERVLGLTDEYHTMIPPQQMAELYRRADVLLLTSDASEGFGLPLLEAMACGLPCVVTDIPAFRTFARPDDYARFVPVGDVEAMAGAVERLIHDTDERQRLSRRGREVAMGYSMQRSYDAMEDVLVSLARARQIAHTSAA